METKTATPLNRRDFLAASAATAGAAALAAVPGLACADAAGSAGDEARAAFEAAAAPIPPVDVPASWDEERQIVVVGSGAAGVNASIRLAQAGYEQIRVRTGGLWVTVVGTAPAA